MIDKKELVRILKLIAEDMEKDARFFDGQPFNGKSVSHALGKQGAAIAGLANIVRLLVDK